ncbi:MAG: hypothetical protein DI537_10500 [Stutzerimonas stutzeri]|nr:MAG: hypothetical protein DI537_10500 [Stutzerimonas stutzeri]
MHIEPYAEFETVPDHEEAVFDGKDFTNAPGVLKWSNSAPPPAIGDEVVVTINNCGPATVTGYFTQGGFLGLLVELHNPPEWHVKQNKGSRRGHIFGAEFRLS